MAQQISPQIQLPHKIIKSSGTSEPFDIEKLEHAIVSSITDNIELRQSVLKHVLGNIKNKITTSTHYINDIIETYLLKNKHYEELQSYMENRLEKNRIHSEKINLLGTRLVTSPDFRKDELGDFSVNQIQIAANRYLQRDMVTGDITESMTAWFDRVASHVVLGSVVYDPEVYDKEGKQEIWSDQDKLSPDDFTEQQLDILHRLYYKLNEEGKMIKPFWQFLDRVWDLLNDGKYKTLYQTYFNFMYQGVFEPNTPTLMNAGTENGKLSACFTLAVNDNLRHIMSVDADSALIFQGAGGLGVNVSYVRPSGANINGTFGAATGPISLVLEIINKITDSVKSGGKRRGANMGLLEYWHPDINEFIDYKIQKIPPKIQEIIDLIKDHKFESDNEKNEEKQKELITAVIPEGNLLNFNISVMFDADFWKHYNDKTSYPLVFDNKVYGFNDAREFINKIATSAWRSAEPGVAFKDNANKANPLLGLRGEINICNPCAEQFMYDGESCTLGSINLSKLIRADGTFDWDRYTVVINQTTRFLNDVLEINKYPTDHIGTESNKSKRIGLGIMGLADLFFLLKIPYNSQEGFWMMEELSKTLYIESTMASIELAHERGSCHWYQEFINSGAKPRDVLYRVYGDVDSELNAHNGMAWKSHLEMLEKTGVRNMWTTTVAPTGTISMIADCTSALEPIFSLVFTKMTNAGVYYYISEPFKQALIEAGIYSQALIEKVEKNYGSCQGIDEIPKEIQKVFVTAMDLHWIDHVVAQSVWQNWIDNSISKTINMPFNVTIEDVKNAYVLAHDLGLKGIALFRDGSRNEQVLHVGSNVQSNKNEQNVQKDTAGTVTIATRNQVERSSKPSNYSMQYIQERVGTELLQDLEEHIKKSSTYFEQGEQCPICKSMTLVRVDGCEQCKNPKCVYAACSSA